MGLLETSVQIVGENITVDQVLSDPSKQSTRNGAKREGLQSHLFVYW